MRWWAITPGSMGVVSYAYKLFGPKQIDPGGWCTPVYVLASEEEVMVFAELLSEASLLSEQPGRKTEYKYAPSEKRTAWESA